MDVWVVAAAAGAGYVVQHLKNLSRGKNKWVDSSSENLNSVTPQSSSSRHKLGDKSGPFNNVLSRKSFGEEMSNREGDKVCEAASDFEVTSTSGYEDENLIMVDSFMSSSSLAPYLDVEDVQGDWESRLPSDSGKGFTSDMSPHPSSGEIGFSYSSRRKRSRLKSRRFDSEFIKPQTSLESCLMAQLYEEHNESEEYALHPLGKPRLRPFLVTDGSKIISTAPHESFTVPIGTAGGKSRLWKDGYSKVNSTVCGIPALPYIEPVEFEKKAKTREKLKHGFERTDSSKASHGDHDNAQGTSDRALLFYLGLTMGIVSSFLANKREVENMKSLLKQNENLVQDLQEELEMKDSLTVKELAADDYESKDVHNDCCTGDTVHPSLEEKFDEESCHEKAEEKSLYEIEAELEAELQRLESSMNSSSLEGKLCNLTALDPDLVPDFHEDKSRSRSFAADINNQFHADSNGSRSSTPRSCPYPVSPRELSLRLHQVIQSRLEERIKELEMALQNSQRKMKYMESEHVHPWGEQSNSGTQNSSTHDSPIVRDGHESVDEPVIINLSGEALAAYNEAYDVFTKVSESDDEDFQAGFENGYHAQYDLMGQHSASNGVQESVFDQRTEEDLYSPANNVVCGRRDGVEDSDQEEMERLLIRQIVEKAKQGSPAVLKAQRAFLLLNIENEH
ncbi:uncharacterized protein LOC131008813 isoform X2 [Salvia miltiorrhiza]|uniref:uncharacterized protein LOC131008813 isoform X2 n=1 Tax=Salvia miltiorrhiza TaxID=226208 RepID=UPI0025AC6097|nr:uncharacterized protein LOC131008813 isoform X2 [Salvia miltiorrhiza]